MTDTAFTIEPMQAAYNKQVGSLLTHGFRGKFQSLVKLNDDDLALFFQKLLDHFPAEPTGQRIVALQNGEAIGTLSMKWKANPGTKQAKHELPSCFNMFGTWNSLKLQLGLHFLNYQPRAGECYIEDVAVHPHHRGKGVGKLLLQWAQHFVQTRSFDILSLHVSGRNKRALHLYEQLSFRTHSQHNSLAKLLLFYEYKWYYMILKLEP